MSTSTNGWRKTLKVKTSISYFSLHYFMFLAALGTAEMAMFAIWALEFTYIVI